MPIAVTIRDVPEDVRDALGRYAQQQGQSLQAFLLALLTRQARFAWNQGILAAVGRELEAGGGAGITAPDAAHVLAAARAERDSQPFAAGDME
ncbi:MULTISPECIES: FitA-like ribbon-helix-helix domain-containing protein [unclassified Frankia]|uniref:FitA-like ribbon-helix-helix domain-containing protein n=1 Tax=unclassified Frankia TaxID=2632575 RepID=UPI0020252226